METLSAFEVVENLFNLHFNLKTLLIKPENKQGISTKKPPSSVSALPRVAPKKVSTLKKTVRRKNKDPSETGMRDESSSALPLSSAIADGSGKGWLSAEDFATIKGALREPSHIMKELDLYKNVGTLILIDRSIGEIDKAFYTAFKALRELNLRGNSLKHLMHLPPTLTILNVYYNCLCEFPHSLRNHQHLIHLGLGFNQISSMSLPPGPSFPSLISLDLSYNHLYDLAAVKNSLLSLPSLRQLFILGNPLCILNNYHYYLIHNLPHLTYLNDQNISGDTRTKAADIIENQDFSFEFSLSINLETVFGTYADSESPAPTFEDLYLPGQCRESYFFKYFFHGKEEVQTSPPFPYLEALWPLNDILTLALTPSRDLHTVLTTGLSITLYKVTFAEPIVCDARVIQSSLQQNSAVSQSFGSFSNQPGSSVSSLSSKSLKKKRTDYNTPEKSTQGRNARNQTPQRRRRNFEEWKRFSGSQDTVSARQKLVTCMTAIVISADSRDNATVQELGSFVLDMSDILSGTKDKYEGHAVIPTECEREDKDNNEEKVSQPLDVHVNYSFY